MTDIVERLRDQAWRRGGAPKMDAGHTKLLEWEAADEIERLRLERDWQYDENVNRIAAEGAAILRAEEAENTLERIALYPPESNEWDAVDKYGEVKEIARVALGLPKEVWW